MLTGHTALGLALATVVLAAHVIIVVVIATTASRIAVEASRAGRDPVDLIQVLTSLIRAMR